MSGKIAALLCAAMLASCANAGVSPAAPAALPADQAAWAAACEDWDEWDKPAPPFKIHGSSYYVGTCGIAVILVKGDSGDILIDTGTAAGADVVAANLRTLGVDPQNIRWLLHSHEHFDHVGGFAAMQALTNSRIAASVPAARVLGSGRDSAEDPQHGMHPPMAPVSVARLVMDGEVITLGNLALTAIETPGHTPGALSWQWRSCEADQCVSIVYADSLSPVSSDSYKFSDHADYVGAYRQALGRVAALDCDILLTPHPSASDMVERLKSGRGLRGSGACRNYADGINARLDSRLDQDMGTPDGR